MARICFILAGLFGLTSLALGAYGSHVLAETLVERTDDPDNLFLAFQTATQYQLVHAILLALIGTLIPVKNHFTLFASAISATFGILLFCGGIYSDVVFGMKQFEVVTPVGGALLMVAWVSVLFYGLLYPSRSAT